MTKAASEADAAKPETASQEISTEDILRMILSDLLGLSAEQVAEMDADTPLFGALPELDSMAVAGLLTEMEDRLNITIDDEDVDGELFETFGSLSEFAKAKVAG